MPEEVFSPSVPITKPKYQHFRLVTVIGTGLFLSLLGAVVFTRLQAAKRSNPTDRFAAGVTIASVPVGGLTREEAAARVRLWARKATTVPITFVAPRSNRRWNLPLFEVGGRYDIDAALTRAFAIGKDVSVWEQIWQGDRPYAVDIEVPFRFNPAAVERPLRRIAQAVHRPAINARARVTESGGIVLAAREAKGIALDVAATKAALLKNGTDALRDGETVALVVREESPLVTAKDLGKMGYVLASFTTDYSSSPSARAHNVELAASKVNGTILPPDQEFSYNQVVGPREMRYGFRNALMFEDGEVVPGVGGGICQVSSTLYNAVVRADLKVTERQNHSVKVTYVRPGTDATVVYGALDFRFRNTTGSPILIMARTKSRRLTFHIYGAKPPLRRAVEIETGPLRYGRNGSLNVSAYKVIRLPDGTTTREYLHTDTYRPARAVRRS